MRESENAKIVFQAKSGNVGRGDIAKLNSDRLREGAEIAIFITLKPSTQGMREEAAGAGTYHHQLMNRSYPCIQIVSIEQILQDGARLEMPLSWDVVNKAQAEDNTEQINIDLF